jgi:hypothetical protein
MSGLMPYSGRMLSGSQRTARGRRARCPPRVRLIRSKLTSAEDGRWVAFVLLPQSRWQSILNYTAILAPFFLLASMIFFLPSLHLAGANIDIRAWLPWFISPLSSEYDLLGMRGIGLNIYAFLMKDQSLVVRAGNRFFIFAYLIALLGAGFLVYRTYSVRRLCIQALLAEAGPTSPSDSAPISIPTHGEDDV